MSFGEVFSFGAPQYNKLIQFPLLAGAAPLISSYLSKKTTENTESTEIKKNLGALGVLGGFLTIGKMKRENDGKKTNFNPS